MLQQLRAVCISHNKGERKNSGFPGGIAPESRHCRRCPCGDWHRQVSLLAKESIDKMRALDWMWTTVILPKT